MNIGLSGGLGCFYHPRHVRLVRASEGILAGRRVWGDGTEEISRVSAVVPQEELFDEALFHACIMTKKGFGALKLTKRALDQHYRCAFT